MRRSAFIFSAILATALPVLAASVQTAKPEQTGFSSERLARIHEMVQRHIDAHDISGAVTLVDAAMRRRTMPPETWKKVEPILRRDQVFRVL